ncbi:restriction endonuclease subunit S [Persephonella sp.]
MNTITIQNKKKLEEEIKNVPYTLPEGWKWVKVKDLVEEIKSGFSCSKKYETTKDKGIPHLRPNNIGYFNKLDLSKIVYIPFEKFNKDEYNLLAGDILFNNTNSKELVGRAIVLKEDFKGGFSNHLTRIRIKKDIVIPEFLSWILNLYWLKGEFLKLANKWIGQAGINNKMLKEILVPLPFKNGKPDLEKQKQIVEKIETIFKEIDKAIILRQKALEDTKKLFESVLDKIFKEAEEDKDNWKWVKFGGIAEFGMGKTPKRSERKYWENGKYYWVSISDMQDKYIKTTKEKVSEKAFSEIFRGKLIPKGTLLMSFKLTIGRTAILDIPAFHNEAIIHIHPQENIYRNFLYWILPVIDYSKYLNTAIKGKTLNKEILKNILIPLPFKNDKPDIEKQKQIADYLDNLHNKIKQLEELQKLQLEKFNKLKESILNKAFRGELI